MSMFPFSRPTLALFKLSVILETINSTINELEQRKNWRLLFTSLNGDDTNICEGETDSRDDDMMMLVVIIMMEVVRIIMVISYLHESTRKFSFRLVSILQSRLRPSSSEDC